MGSEVRKKEKYIGKEIPGNIEGMKEKFFIEICEERWYPYFDKIKRGYTNEQKTKPPSLREKDTGQFAIRFTYHTNKIEGSTLTLRETADLLEKGITPSRRPVEDVRETEAHKEIFCDMLAHGGDISLKLVLQWHKKLFQYTKHDVAGMTRKHSIGISGSSFEPPTPIELDNLIRNFFAWYRKNKGGFHPVHLAAFVHLKFVTIHPFADGNGRILRLFANFVLKKHGYPMLIIDYAHRTGYYNALERSQINGDETIFATWFFRRYINEYRKYIK
ncbi:MAG: Fic family protein [Candidatus Thermoplasmatota archaeon]|nr:Fic family protein [Candidatus Thermoplasmatota archaeon]